MKNIFKFISFCLLFILAMSSCVGKKSLTYDSSVVTDKFSKDTLGDKCFEDFFSNFTYNKEFQSTRCLTKVVNTRNKEFQLIRQPIEVVDMSKLYKTQFYNSIFYLYNSHEKVEYCKELTNKKYLSILKPTENKKTIVSFNKIDGHWFLVDITNFDFEDITNFEAFIYRFSTDSIFRNEHIKFPLKYNHLGGGEDGYETITDYLTRENVFQNYFFDKGEFVFFHSNNISNEKHILIHLGGVENGISAFYYFEKFNDTWILIEYNNYSM